MTDKLPHLFTIAASANFADTLARGLIARLEGQDFALSDCIIYLPTRRAARNFGEAFAGVLGGAALLPQFRALGESEDEEISFESLDLPPAISPIRRQLLLANLVRQWDVQGRGGSLTFAQAAALADSLAKVMDEIEREGADLGALKDLAPAALAGHWQQVTRFLDVIHAQWPAILAAEGALNPAARSDRLLASLAERLAAHPPAGLVIAAGSTGSIPATARLLGVIANLERGAVVLPGLDRTLDAQSWTELDPGHPQFGLKKLLTRLHVERADVADWQGGAARPTRETLLRETLRPAPTTDAWRAIAEQGSAEIAAGLEGLTLAAANDPAQEALVVALALRETLETENRTAALVTPDRNLARRVAGELSRWGIAIDDSAGRPLAHASAGAFLCLLAEAAEAQFAPVPLLALLKHPFATLGEAPGPFRAHARELDRLCLRGPRPDPGLAGIAKAITRNGKAAELARWWEGIAALLAPLEALFAKAEVALGDLIEAHVAAAEGLSCGSPPPPRAERMEGEVAVAPIRCEGRRGSSSMWQDADGEAAATLIADFRDSAQGLPGIAPHFYPALLRTLAMKVPVRPRGGRRRAIAILGPLEARLQQVDLTILGGLTEGSWPAGPGADPWFSRPMRETLGLEQPERAIGLAAHDFSMLGAGREVLLTRALKSDGVPTIASRWLQRLTQLTQGLNLQITSSVHVAQARALAEVAPGPRLTRPAPTPAVAARPRRLTVTEIETWLRDPYAIYAKHVLKLKPLDPLDEAVGPLERGSAFHRALEIFVRDHPGPLPDDALARLIAICEQLFAEEEIPFAQRAVWRPRFANAARWFLDWEGGRRTAVASSHLEVSGRMHFAAPAGPFELACKADRIDLLKGGGAAIIDYKTGSLPDKKWLVQFLTPQLPLEGAILAAGGFDGLAAAQADELIYLRFSGKGDQEKILDGTLAPDAAARLAQRIAWFDEDATPYHSRIAPQNARIAGDYDHLARVREWSVSGWGEET
jgi:ATP-dependent helicase/nuclease subunit B